VIGMVNNSSNNSAANLNNKTGEGLDINIKTGNGTAQNKTNETGYNVLHNLNKLSEDGNGTKSTGNNNNKAEMHNLTAGGLSSDNNRSGNIQNAKEENQNNMQEGKNSTEGNISSTKFKILGNSEDIGNLSQNNGNTLVKENIISDNLIKNNSNIGNRANINNINNNLAVTSENGNGNANISTGSEGNFSKSISGSQGDNKDSQDKKSSNDTVRTNSNPESVMNGTRAASEIGNNTINSSGQADKDHGKSGNNLRTINSLIEGGQEKIGSEFNISNKNKGAGELNISGEKSNNINSVSVLGNTTQAGKGSINNNTALAEVVGIKNDTKNGSMTVNNTSNDNLTSSAGKAKGKMRTRRVTKRKRLPFKLVQIFFNRSRRVLPKVTTYFGPSNLTNMTNNNQTIRFKDSDLEHKASQVTSNDTKKQGKDSTDIQTTSISLINANLENISNVSLSPDLSHTPHDKIPQVLQGKGRNFCRSSPQFVNHILVF